MQRVGGQVGGERGEEGQRALHQRVTQPHPEPVDEDAEHQPDGDPARADEDQAAHRARAGREWPRVAEAALTATAYRVSAVPSLSMLSPVMTVSSRLGRCSRRPMLAVVTASVGREDRAQGDRGGQRQPGHVEPGRAAHHQGGEQHQADRQQGEGPHVVAQVQVRALQRGGVDERRQHREQDQGRG